MFSQFVNGLRSRVWVCTPVNLMKEFNKKYVAKRTSLRLLCYIHFSRIINSTDMLRFTVVESGKKGGGRGVKNRNNNVTINIRQSNESNVP